MDNTIKNRTIKTFNVRVLSPTSIYINPKGNLKEPVLKLAAKPVDPDWIIIGSICGVISVLLIMAISSITYYIYVSRKRSMTNGSTSSVMGGAISDETDASSFDSDIKTISGKFRYNEQQEKRPLSIL